MEQTDYRTEILHLELPPLLHNTCNPQSNATNFEVKKVFWVVEAIASGVLEKLDILSIEHACEKLRLSGRVVKDFPDEKLAKIKQVIYERKITENLNSPEIGPELCRIFGVSPEPHEVLLYSKILENYNVKTTQLIFEKTEQLN
jgi:hypothetical protein